MGEKTFYDRVCRTIVGVGLMYGCFYGGKSWVEFQQSRMPYQIMKVQDKYMLVDNESDMMVEVSKELFRGIESKVHEGN